MKNYLIVLVVCIEMTVSVCLLNSFEYDEDIFDPFVRPNGVLYPTETLHDKMKTLAMSFLMNDKIVDDKIVDGIASDEQLLTICVTVPSVAAHFARKQNAWKPTRKDFLPVVQSSCL